MLLYGKKVKQWIFQKLLKTTGMSKLEDAVNIKGIHVILAWNKIGRPAIFGMEIGVPDREVFSRRKKFNFSGKNLYF